MSIQILSPQAEATFTTTQSITLSGINGPAGEIKVNGMAIAIDTPPAPEDGEPQPDVNGAFSITIPPITTPGNHTITVQGPAGKSASVVITVTAAVT